MLDARRFARRGRVLLIADFRFFMLCLRKILGLDGFGRGLDGFGRGLDRNLCGLLGLGGLCVWTEFHHQGHQ